jgi:LemA protein
MADTRGRLPCVHGAKEKMTWSHAFWLLPALLVFWAVGAYNRLVRLRAGVRQGYASLDAELVRQAELLQSALPPSEPGGVTQAGELHDSVALAWRSLQSALAQFSAVLSATRHRALDANATASLFTARGVLLHAWQRVLLEGHDLAGAPVPDALQARWDDLAREERTATGVFNDAVVRYNSAIRQFPALFLAGLFGMRPAGTL